MESVAAPAIATQDNAQHVLNTVQRACERFHIVSLTRSLEVCERLLAHNPVIDVAVLGQFKAGKSSFLNSLIGKPLLPVGVTPVTTVITRLQYARRERAVVTHFDGAVRDINLTDVEQFTSEAKNPGNQKNVEAVDIEIPALEQYAGLRFVDTPGLGSIFRSHREISEGWFPEVGAAVLAVSADRPLSEHDLQLIRDLSLHTPNIVLLLTKTDLLTPGQQEEVVAFFNAALEKELDRQFPLFLYSDRVDTERWKARIETELFLRLAGNRSKEFERIVRYKLRSLLSGCGSYLEIALKTSLQADADREALRRLILDQRLTYELIRDELLMIERENAGQTRPLIMKRLHDIHWPSLARTLQAELAQALPTWRGSLWKLTRRYEDWLTETVTDQIDHISNTEHQHFWGTLKKAHASFSRSLESFRTLLNSNLEKVLGLTLAEADWKVDVREPGQPDIAVGRTFDFNLDLLWFLIPMGIFRPLVEKHFMRQLPREVEVNLSRLASQWTERINRSIQEMREQTQRYINDELTTIEALLAKASDRTDEIRTMIEELHTALHHLKG